MPIPEPVLFLEGCRPLVPYHGHPADARGNVPPFHAPADPERIGGSRWPPELCPVCKGQIGVRRRPAGPDEEADTDGMVPYRVAAYHPDDPEFLDHKTYCVQCESLSARNEARARAQLAVAVAGRRRDAAAGTMEAKAANARMSGLRLTESERRRVWFGSRGDGLSLPADLISRVQKGREFLAAIGQLPDWSLVLDGRGKVRLRLPTNPGGPPDPAWLDEALACLEAGLPIPDLPGDAYRAAEAAATRDPGDATADPIPGPGDVAS